MGSQSKAKTLFLLTSMLGWLMVGAALIYLSPFLADRFIASELTHLWMTNLSRGGYDPTWAGLGGGLTLAVLVVANVIWYQRFEGKL